MEFDLINNIFPHHNSEKMETINHPSEERGEDIFNWKGLNTILFSISNDYNSI